MLIFLLRKYIFFYLKRGWPDQADNIHVINDLIKSNKNNEEKIKIINKIFNLTK